MRGIGATFALACAVVACAGPAATPTPASEPTPVPTDAPPSGRLAIKVVSVDAVSVSVRYTDAQIFFNDAADEAAREDGHPGGAPSRVWIRDLPTRGTLPIDPDATVTLMSWDAAGNRVPKVATADIFVHVLTSETPVPGWDTPLYVFVFVETGRITSIDQPDLP